MDVSEAVIAIILAFARISSFIFFIPFLQGGYIPAVAKITISLSLSMVVADKMTDLGITNMLEFLAVLSIQVMIGLTLAMVINMIFSAARIAGSILDLDMGLASSQVLDPGSGVPSSAMSNIFYMIFVLIFISLGGINQLIIGILYSFSFTTPEFFMGDPDFFDMILIIFTYMMTAGVQIALPLTVSMFMVNFMLLILGRTAPRMNILMNMFGVKIAFGMLLIVFTLPFFEQAFTIMSDSLMEKYLEVLEVMMKR